MGGWWVPPKRKKIRLVVVEGFPKLNLFFSETTFLSRTMIDNECNILSNMSKTEFREFRSLMVEMVLHTGDQGGGGHEVMMVVEPGVRVFQRGTRPCNIYKHFRHVDALLPIEVHEELGSSLKW